MRHFFNKKRNINIFAIFLDKNLNVTLANKFVNFLTTGHWSIADVLEKPPAESRIEQTSKIQNNLLKTRAVFTA